MSESIWTPTKPAEAYNDEEVKQAPDFVSLRSIMPAVIDDAKVLELARNAIEARWVTIRDSRRDELVTEFVNNLLECDPELQKVNRIEISLDDDGISVEFKKARAVRWTEETYRNFVGEYSKEYRSERHPSASGEYKLRIAEGRNEGEVVFMELTEPSGKVLSFPPLNTESPVGRDADGKRLAEAQVVECTSISRLLRDSDHKTTLSVWQYFNLGKSAEGEKTAS